MKKLEFETSKGRFLVVGEKINLDTWDYKYPLVFISKLSEIPEEEASEIVDEPFGLGVGDNNILVFKDYEDEDNAYLSSIDSLHSLLKSKGIHLFKNPLKDSELSFIGNVSGIDMLLAKQKHDRRIKEAEEKTFYNPYIFKI